MAAESFWGMACGVTVIVWPWVVVVVVYGGLIVVVDVVTGTEAEVGEDSQLEAQIERADVINSPNVNQQGTQQPIN